MKRFLAVLFLLLIPLPSYSQTKVIGDINYEPYKKIVLKASNVTDKDTEFTWDVYGTSDPDLVERGDTLYVWATPGSYKVLLTAYWIEKGKIKVDRTRFSFTVGTPTPPVPPTPIEPTDPLYLSLKAAWLQETAADKVHRTDLANLYKQVAQKYVNDTTLVKLVDLLALMRKASQALMPDTALPKLRRAVADATNSILPRDPNLVLDTVLRQKCGAHFLKVATALEALP